MATLPLALALALLLVGRAVAADTAFYELLGVKQDASTRDIRRAFKRIALEKHPDKNPDKEGAHDEFVRINRAFEVLKDKDLRKKYDLHGEKGLEDDQHQRGNQYQGWGYYNEEFGLYDEDPQVETPGHNEFFDSAVNSEELWFVNFYSPGCSHCHDLAPEWRRFATMMLGVIKVAAVNCQDSWGICRQMGIRAYPTLLFFGKHAGRYEPQQGPRSADDLRDFVVSRLPEVQRVRPAIALGASNTHHVLALVCVSWEAECPSAEDAKMIASSVDPYMKTVMIDCSSHRDECDQHGLSRTEARVYVSTEGAAVYPPSGSEWSTVYNLQAVAEAALDTLPRLEAITPSEYIERASHLADSMVGNVDERVIFVLLQDPGDAETLKLERLLQRLAVPVAPVRIDCTVVDAGGKRCSDLGLHQTPELRVVRKDGFEIYHADHRSNELQQWFEAGVDSRVTTVTHATLPEFVAQTDSYFLDFFAPWCPPCKRMLPIFREVSVNHPEIKFGTVDCTRETLLCNNYAIQSYPSPVFFHAGEEHHFDGDTTDPGAFAEFIEDVYNPPVVSITPLMFETDIIHAPSELWMVDFYAPWCGHCQQLEPEYRYAAKRLAGVAKLGKVNCDAHKDFCRQQNVRAYPTVRTYPPVAPGQARYHEDFRSYLTWGNIYQSALNKLPSKVTAATPEMLAEQVAAMKQPVLVSFGAPWCQPCNRYKRQFSVAAHRLAHLRVQFLSLDCQRYKSTCHREGVPHYPYIKLYTRDGVEPADALESDELGWWLEQRLVESGYDPHGDDTMGASAGEGDPQQRDEL